jgi:hypothetical protein
VPRIFFLPRAPGYIATLAGPFIGLGCGYLLVSSLRVKDVGIRHATEATTAVRNISPMLLMMIFSFPRSACPEFSTETPLLVVEADANPSRGHHPAMPVRKLPSQLRRWVVK